MIKRLLAIPFIALLIITTSTHAFEADKVMETVKTIAKGAGSAVGQAVAGAASGSNAAKIQSATVDNVTQTNTGGVGNVNATNYNNAEAISVVQSATINGTATQENRYGTGNTNGVNVNKANTGVLVQNLQVKTLKQTNTGGGLNVNCGNCSLKP